MEENIQNDWSQTDLDLLHQFQKILDGCPYCGSKAQLFLGPFKDRKPYVQCVGNDDEDDNCWAIVEGNSITEAVTKWNRRVPMDRMKVAIHARNQELKSIIAAFESMSGRR